MKRFLFIACVFINSSLVASDLALKVDFTPKSWVLDGNDSLTIKFNAEVNNLTNEKQFVSLFYLPQMILSIGNVVTAKSAYRWDLPGGAPPFEIEPHKSLAFSYSARLNRKGNMLRLSGGDKWSTAGWVGIFNPGEYQVRFKLLSFSPTHSWKGEVISDSKSIIISE
jgi:hypothetical protein